MQGQCTNVILFISVAAVAKCLQDTLPLGKQEPLLPVCSFEYSLLKTLASNVCFPPTGCCAATDAKMPCVAVLVTVLRNLHL